MARILTLIENTNGPGSTVCEHGLAFLVERGGPSWAVPTWWRRGPNARRRSLTTSAPRAVPWRPWGSAPGKPQPRSWLPGFRPPGRFRSGRNSCSTTSDGRLLYFLSYA